MIAYLDTNVLLFLNEGELRRIPSPALTLIESSDNLISPAVFLELEYLSELGKVLRPARDLVKKLQGEISLCVCDLPFAEVVEAAIDEKWTRDPFDRMIVAQAKANGFAPLISSDRKIAEHYPRTVW